MIALLAGAPAPASAQGERSLVTGPTAARIGIADQKPEVFDDTRLTALGVGHARRSVAWDAMRHDWQVAELDAWMDGARRAGMEPLVTFARSRMAARRHRPPTPQAYLTEFRAFRRRYPSVRAFSAWNEANHCGEGTCRRPGLVARYHDAIRRNCSGCKVLAADVLDQPNIVRWVTAFRRAAKVEPRYWGLHNYVGANRFDPRRTEQLLRATKGEVWLTETGGLVARRNRSTVKLRQGKAHAASVTRYVFDRLARLSPRITRVYLYHWRSTSSRDTWDSALIGPDNRRRPAFAVLQRVLRQAAAAQERERGRRRSRSRAPAR